MARTVIKYALRVGLLLTAFAVGSTAFLALTHDQTADIVARNELLALQARIDMVIPKSLYDNDLLHDTLTLSDRQQLGSDKPVTVYRARKAGKPVGVVFQTVAPDGYSGNIFILVGILADGRLAGVRIVSHKETPGLGDPIEIEKSPWILSFDRKSLHNPTPAQWAVRKDGGVFDQFTGATITPRAVVGAVKKALEFYQSKQKLLYASQG